MVGVRFGIDLGGTKIEAIALGPDNEIRARIRKPTPQGHYQGTLEAIRHLVVEIEQQAGAAKHIGVAIPGAVSLKTGLIKNANSTCLNDKPLLQDLNENLNRPIRVENDANCFTLSEAMDGSGKEYESVFGVILGTGVGGGFAWSKRILSGRNRIAGEWGHNPLPYPQNEAERSTECYCGRKSCLENYLCGPALEQAYNETASHSLKASEIAGLADEGEAIALQVMTVYEDRLARGLANVINILDPDAVILGGGLSNIDRLYRQLPDLIRKYVFSDMIDTPILPPAHGDSSGVRGAAWLWNDLDP